MGLLNGLPVTGTAALLLSHGESLCPLCSSSPPLWVPVICVFAPQLDGGLLQGGRSCSLGGGVQCQAQSFTFDSHNDLVNPTFTNEEDEAQRGEGSHH